MKKFKPKILVLLLFATLLMMLQSCAMIEGAKPLSEMSAKEKVTIMYGVYNSQYADYMRVVGYAKDDIGTWVRTSQPELSPEQINTLNSKKKVLVQVYPMMKLYGSYIDSGVIPDIETEQQIFALLDSLVLLVPD